ncbi:MAG: tetratricopeptide repeat protein [Gammaproteobacteria bacterium]|nr:tetratricopeptide repeat protein [Gammaproteobacteria bacterium]
MALFFALLHAVPVVLAAVLFRNLRSLNVAAGIMALIAVFGGSPQYMFPDLLAVGAAWFISRKFIAPGSSESERPDLERLIEGETIQRRRSSLSASTSDRLPRPVAEVNERDTSLLGLPPSQVQPQVDRRSPDDAYKMGLRCESEKYGPPDLAQAATFYQTAASAGHTMAQYRLGLMFTRGDGVPKDEIQAYAWLRLAAIQGIEVAGAAASSIRQHMDPAQLAQAQAMSRNLGAKIFPA